MIFLYQYQQIHDRIFISVHDGTAFITNVFVMLGFMFHVAVKPDFVITFLDESASRTPLRAWIEFVG
ncbi:hypothetical protein ANHS_1228 [Ligilactobacillus ruminis ATCC 25644]|nr:hypothetical protein ANHS_1228 [Ligilactobacillus ruminis ATCC 25644]